MRGGKGVGGLGGGRHTHRRGRGGGGRIPLSTERVNLRLPGLEGCQGLAALRLLQSRNSMPMEPALF